MTDTKSKLKPSEVLSKAADLIEPEGAWTQGVFAKDAAGRTTEYGWIRAEDAVCLCLFGAINVASGREPDWDSGHEEVEGYLRSAISLKRPFESSIAEWNDEPGRTQPEVVAALRKASDLAKADGQ